MLSLLMPPAHSAPFALPGAALLSWRAWREHCLALRLQTRLMRAHQGFCVRVEICTETGSESGLLFDDGGQILLWRLQAGGRHSCIQIPKRQLRWHHCGQAGDAQIICGRAADSLRLRYALPHILPSATQARWSDKRTRGLWQKLHRLQAD
ncbi:hypothetical protein V8J88_04185 [Massilia sp. W12]|uniref:hypothetical protein n=1 Tax=Massilia sp. W12 TaxID=3126507 RepID=UPI0030CC6D0E